MIHHSRIGLTRTFGRRVDFTHAPGARDRLGQRKAPSTSVAAQLATADERGVAPWAVPRVLAIEGIYSCAAMKVPTSD